MCVRVYITITYVHVIFTLLCVMSLSFMATSVQGKDIIFRCLQPPLLEGTRAHSMMSGRIAFLVSKVSPAISLGLLLVVRTGFLLCRWHSHIVDPCRMGWASNGFSVLMECNGLMLNYVVEHTQIISPGIIV